MKLQKDFEWVMKFKSSNNKQRLSEETSSDGYVANDSRKSSVNLSAVKLIIIVALSVFICEYILMMILHHIVPSNNEWINALSDSIALTILILPLLYLLIFRPMVITIKERRNNEKKLTDSEEKFKNLFNDSNDSIILHNYDGKIIDANKKALKQFGFSRKKFISMDVKTLHPPDSLSTSQKAFGEIKKRGVVTFEIDFKKSNGDIFPAEVSSSLFKVKGETVVQGIIRDISDRKKAEEVLQKKDEELDAIFQNTPLAMMLVDRERRVVKINAQAVSMSRRSEEDLIGLRGGEAIRCVHAFDNPKGCGFGPACENCVVRNTILETFRTGKEFHRVEALFNHNSPDNGTKEKNILVTTAPLKELNEDLVLVCLEDITERKQSEERLEKISSFSSRATGIDFFSALVQSTAEVMNMNIIFAAELISSKPATARSLAMWIGDGFVENIEWTLSGTPCDEVVKGKITCFSEGVQEKFPDDKWLADTESQSYIGIPITDAEGKIVGHMGMLNNKPMQDKEQIENILRIFADRAGTELERKRAEESLWESQELFHTVVENSHDGILILKENDFKFSYVNKRICEILGRSRDELIGFDFRDVLDEESKELVTNSYLRRMKGEKLHPTYEFSIVRKDGEKRFVEITSSVVKDSKGNISTIAQLLDITERKKALEKIKNQAYYVYQNPFPVLRCNYEGLIIGANPAAQKTIDENIVDKSIFDFLPGLNKTFSEELKSWETIQIEEKISDKIFQFTFKKDTDTKSIFIFSEDITSIRRGALLQSAVYQISEASKKAKSLDELYKSIHEVIGTVMPANNFFIASYDDKKDLLSFDYFVDEIDDYQDFAKPGRGFTAYVLRTGKSLFLDNTAQEELIKTGEVEAIGSKSPIWIGVPLIIEHKTIGAMVVQHYSDPNAYGKEDLHLLEYISEQIAGAIVNKRSEEELRKLSSAVKQSSAAIVITDTLGNFEYVNPKFTEITGYTIEEVKGKSTNIMKSGESSPEQYKELWETITSGKEWRGEFHNKKKNGELYWDKSSISPIRDTDGRITHFLAVKDDITEQKKNQKELIEAKEKAEEMNRLKSNFLANMSHELRTPLIGITGFADVLMEELKNEEDKQMAESILQSGKRLTKTLDFILDLSMLESDKLKVNSARVNIVHAVDESLESSRKAALEKGLEFNFDRNGKEIYCNVDKNLLIRVINYFLDNSIKFTDTGSISVKVFSNGKANIQITDTGIGIPKDKLKTIFEPFRQASEGNAREYEGTGLGLTLAKKFIEVLGGTVTIESEINKGTILTIEFEEIK